MTYQVLARKWRPQDFESLVGQEPIVTALRNALTEKRIAQAYLFSGIRGVGKTTAARVFAKALNCETEIGSEKRPGGDPCNDCPPCRGITSGSEMDVLEIDAATHSKVEQVRELTESLRYGAANNRYRVIVLDEVHRLSRQAFDALLKIVEEPPPHLVFIFATTEIDAVPATVLSRCQEFQFRRVPSPVLAAYLRTMADAEEITVSDAALRMIARAGEGSVRDSVALLDQLATFGGGTIDDQDANQLLGGFDAAVFHGLLGAILEGRHAAVSETVREIESNGWDPQHVFSHFLAYVRDGLHLALGGRPESIDLPLEDAQRLAAQVGGVGYESLLQLSQLLLSSEQTVRRSEFGLLALEITWLRAAELPKITRIEDLLSGRVPADLPRELAAANVAAPPVERKVTPPPSPEPPPLSSAEPSPAAVPESSAAPPNETLLAPEPADASGDASDAAKVEQFRGRMTPAIQALFAADPEFNDGTLVLYGDSLLKKRLAGKRNSERVREAVTELWGPATEWEVRHAASASSVESASAVEKAPATEKIAPSPVEPTPTSKPEPQPASKAPPNQGAVEKYQQEPAVQAVLDLFPGSIGRIDPRTREQEN